MTRRWLRGGVVVVTNTTTHDKGSKTRHFANSLKNERSGGDNTSEATPVGAGNDIDCYSSSSGGRRRWKWSEECKEAR